MIRILALLKTDLIQLGRYDHPPGHEHRDPPEEFAKDYSVAFVEHGEFAMAHQKRMETLRVGSVILTRPGMYFRCKHSQEIPDDVCLCVSFHNRASAEEAFPSIAPSPKAKSSRFTRSPCNRLAYLNLRLSRLLARNAEPIAIEALAGEILHAGFDLQNAGETRLFSSRQLAWYTERIEAVRHFLDHECDHPHSLSSLSARVNMSPFHFARVFCALVGKPPHRYLLEIRLQRAAEMLRSGLSVTDACFQSGFNNLSHFSRRFRRQFGVQPSRLVH